MKKQKGITLISLVITIIILIILAGISISALVGENGIITKAKEAKQNITLASEEEQRQLNLLYESLEKEVSLGDEESLINEFLEFKKKIAEAITEKGVPTAETDNADTMAENIRKIESEEKDPTLAEQITSANYGDYVFYSIDLNNDGNPTNDWKIFYKEGNDVFIIAADYLLASKLPTTCGFGNIGSNLDGSYPYRAYWAGTGGSVPTSLQETSQNTLFKATLYTLNSNYINSRCVSTLLNTNNWTSFVDSRRADYAIGSLTLEMWCASWNEKGYTAITPTANSSDYGYKVNDSTYITGLSTSDSLYFPHTETKDNCWGYWLASPSANYDNRLMGVLCGSIGSFDSYTSFDVCVRPLVHLKSGITAIKDNTTGVWNLQGI